MPTTYLPGMTFRPTETDLVLHREVVKGALTGILGLQEIDGRAVGSVVDEYYDGMRTDARMLVLHDDPLRLAYLLSGEYAEPKMSVENERASLSALWSMVARRMGLTERTGPAEAESMRGTDDEQPAEETSVIQVEFNAPTTGHDEDDSDPALRLGR